MKPFTNECIIADFSCSRCGAEGFSLAWSEPIPAEMLQHRLCFHCNFWRERATETDLIVIEGSAYSDGGRKPKNYRGFMGFGGREFTIECFNGKLIETNNLWHRGEVPTVWRADIPNNARWKVVEKAQIEHGQGFYGLPRGADK